MMVLSARCISEKTNKVMTEAQKNKTGELVMSKPKLRPKFFSARGLTRLRKYPTRASPALISM
jgi:hypothetical protein